MVRKTKLSTDSDDKLAETVRASAHQIWQAGLGAFAKAQEEGGKLFALLVQEGVELQKRTQKLAEDKVNEMADNVSKLAGGVGKHGANPFGRLEQTFEEHVAQALARLGVPTMKEVEALSARIDALSKALEGQSAKPARKTTATAGAKIATVKAGVAKKTAANRAKPTRKKLAAKPGKTAD